MALADRDDPAFLDAVHNSAVKAYEMAGIGPADVDVAEVHDVADLQVEADTHFRPLYHGKAAFDPGKDQKTGQAAVECILQIGIIGVP